MDNRIILETVSLAFLRECFLLDDAKGGLIWKVRPDSHFSTPAIAKGVNKRMAGRYVGAKSHKRDRSNVHLMGKYYLLHRIVFALSRGIELEAVPAIIDHIDGNEANSRPDNLRGATASQSTMNRSLLRTGKHAAKGVKREKCGTWSASITFDGKTTHLGTFDSKAEAAAAYIGAARVLHQDFFRDPRPSTQAAA